MDSCKKPLTLRQIARVAAAEGMTAREAATKYGINMYSLRKVICRHDMPNLVSDEERDYIRQFSNMNDQQMLNYKAVLELPKNKDKAKVEKELFWLELKRRGITVA